MSRHFVLSFVNGSEVLNVADYYSSISSQFLLPRTPDQVKKFVENQSAFKVTENGTICAVCYLNKDNHPTTNAERWELGGIFVAEPARQEGIASVLVSFALASHLTQDPDSTIPVMAHVHEENDAPRTLLNRLGFERDEAADEVYDGSLFPHTFRKNSAGKVVGHVFKLIELKSVIKKIQQHKGKLKSGSTMDVELYFFKTDRSAFIEAIKNVERDRFPSRWQQLLSRICRARKRSSDLL